MATSMTHDATGAVPVDPAELRADVQAKNRQNARHPDAGFHSHTERHVALRCRYNVAAIDAPVAVESLTGRWRAVCRPQDDVRRGRTGGEANARGLDVQGFPFRAVRR